MTNVHLEPWKFGRGWTLERLTVEMIEPRYLPLIGYADGWSAATAGEIVGVAGVRRRQERPTRSARCARS